jgi:hypothetical protein
MDDNDKAVFCISFYTSILSLKCIKTHLNALRSPSDLEAGCSFSSFTHPFTCDQKTKTQTAIQQSIVNYTDYISQKCNSWQDQDCKGHWDFRKTQLLSTHNTAYTNCPFLCKTQKYIITLDIKYKKVTKRCTTMVIWTL